MGEPEFVEDAFYWVRRGAIWSVAYYTPWPERPTRPWLAWGRSQGYQATEEFDEIGPLIGKEPPKGMMMITDCILAMPAEELIRIVLAERDRMVARWRCSRADPATAEEAPDV